MSSVVLDQLVKRYGETTAVDAVDLVVRQGEFLVLLGPSGCGKTTTLRCIAGLETISDGRILIDDKPVSTRSSTLAPEKRGIGMVFQSYAVWPHMTLFENVAFGLRLRGLAAGKVADKVGEALELVGLGPLADRGIHQLSGGQQQRVALARAAALEPKVLLFDEPLSNLDAQLRERMRFELRQLQRRLGITAIYVTHDQQEAMVVADRIVLMRGGRIEQVGTPAEIYRAPASLFAAQFIGLTNVFPAKVVATEGASSRIRTEGGVEFECESQDFPLGADVQALVRPENILIRDGDNGTVVENTYLGNMSDIVLQLGDGLRLRAQASPAVDAAPGARVGVVLPPAAVRLLAK